MNSCIPSETRRKYRQAGPASNKLLALRCAQNMFCKRRNYTHIGSMPTSMSAMVSEETQEFTW